MSADNQQERREAMSMLIQRMESLHTSLGENLSRKDAQLSATVGEAKFLLQEDIQSLKYAQKELYSLIESARKKYL